MSEVTTQMCIEKYEQLKNLKLVGEVLKIPWQTVSILPKRNRVYSRTNTFFILS
jgi:hypothetical protein